MKKIFYKNKQGHICQALQIHFHSNEDETVEMYYLDDVDDKEVERIAKETKAKYVEDGVYVRVMFASYGWMIIISQDK